MKYFKGKLEDYEKSNRGYITGSFFNNGLINHDENIEIKYEKISDGLSVGRHCHAKSKSWVIVVKGAMYFKIDEEEVTVGAGEFLIFLPGVSEEVLKVEPGTEVISIHSPSVEGRDKVVVE